MLLNELRRTRDNNTVKNTKNLSFDVTGQSFDKVTPMLFTELTVYSRSNILQRYRGYFVLESTVSTVSWKQLKAEGPGESDYDDERARKNAGRAAHSTMQGMGLPLGWP